MEYPPEHLQLDSEKLGRLVDGWQKHQPSRAFLKWRGLSVNPIYDEAKMGVVENLGRSPDDFFADLGDPFNKKLTPSSWRSRQKKSHLPPEDQCADRGADRGNIREVKK